MTNISQYLHFIKTRGRKVSEINSGSEEIALAVKDALDAIEILKELQMPIFGGDILSENNNGMLVYAYQLWGYEYQCLNWYCNKIATESYPDYINRSYKSAKESILNAAKVAAELKRNCYIVIVI